MSSRIAFRNFTGGEVTPTISARYDLQKFGSFLQCCENFLPNLHGDVERRPGTRYVAELGGPAVLVPFRFNTERTNNYALLFQEGVIRVAHEDGLIPGVSMASDYALDDVYALSVAQVGDLVYLAHTKYPLRKVIRSGAAPDYAWSMVDVRLNQSLSAPAKPAVSFVRDNPDDDAPLNYTLNYMVTAVDADGVESLPSPAGSAVGKYPTDWVVGNHVDLSWPAVAGAKEYNIYRESAGYYGFIGVVSADDISGGTISGLQSGAQIGSLVHFKGAINREIVDYNSMPGYEDKNSDVTSDLVVGPDPGQNAFLLDGKLFVWCTKTTKTTTWKRGNDGSWTGGRWHSSTSVASESFWAMVVPVDAAQPSGAYPSYQTGDTGTSPDAPTGPIGVYDVKPVYAEGSKTLSFVDQNFEADTSMTPKEDWDPFANGNNPATVAFHQQRMVLGGTRDNPASFFMSRTGDYENFRKSRPLQDDDPVEYMLASGSIDEIKWVIGFGELLIGTSGAEYKASSGGASITPNDVQINVESYWGSAGLAPLIIGNSVLHCQRSGSHVRDLHYSWEKDGYAGNDLSLLAPQLVETHKIRQWAFQQSPGSTVWAVRDDGILLGLTYMQEQNVFAWSRHVTDGKVLSVVVLSGDEEDAVLMVVEREIAGVRKYFLERLARRFRSDDRIEEAFFVDCGITATHAEAVEEIAGLDHLEGAEVAALADGSPEEGHVVKDGKIRLRYPARVAHVGLNFRSVLAPLPVETDTQSGSTLGKRRAYGKCVLRLHRSVGGKYAASYVGDLFDVSAWGDRHFYDLPFVPVRFGEAVRPFSGDLEISLPSGQDNDTMIWIMQDRPMPFRLVAIAADVDFGEV